ncbi:MAG: hypothetical protein FJW27_06460 [Acidimicrobiia bacterium]|nr:hypothetical protein [Acidimicrobiia bacterium]
MTIPTGGRFTPIAFGVLSLLVAFERPALAYIDPGSGSLSYQTILSAILGIGLTSRRLLGALKRVGRRFASPVAPAAEEAHDRGPVQVQDEPPTTSA